VNAFSDTIYTMAKQSDSYNEGDIQALKGLEAVRVRPSMYIGNTGSQGLHHLVWEIMDNSVDEAMAGHSDRITIRVADDGKAISIEDNGRGIPVGIHPTEGISTLQLVLCTLHAGGKFGGSGYSASGGLHGVGASCVNALSTEMVATVKRDGKVHEIKFAIGEVTQKIKKTRAMKRGEDTGTKIEFRPDPTIFKDGTEFDERVLIARFREAAFLNRGLIIDYENGKTGTKTELKFDGGIADYVSFLAENKDGHYPAEPIFIEGTGGDDDGTKVQVSFLYTESDDDTVLCFANNIKTIDGGTHLTGFKKSLTRIVNTFYKSLGIQKDKEPNLTGDDIQEGITAVISVLTPTPEFVGGNTKAKLGTVNVESITSQVVYDELTRYFEKNSAIIKKIIQRAQIAQNARSAAKRQADLIKRKSIFGERGGMPDKLSDCRSNKREETELFIVEGNSAAGSAKGGRDSETQAILPIRGKIINAEKHGLAALLKNEEIQSLIKAIGTGVKENFDISKLRYNKIIIMADADDDGCHIASLLITFFFRYMKQLAIDGHLYLSLPPLYRVKVGKKTTYCWTEAEVSEATKDASSSKLYRFKGLGEMDEEELGETTMDKDKRRIIQLQVSDLGDAEHMVSVLMGSNVAARKNHIKTNINSVIA